MPSGTRTILSWMRRAASAERHKVDSRSSLRYLFNSMVNERTLADGCIDGYGKLGLYPIRVVSKMTGINVHTLRAWERRYGVPRPSRSAGTHRLYDASDIATIRRVQELTMSGLTPGRACAYVMAEDMEAQAAVEVESPPAPDRGCELCGALVRAFTELNEDSAGRILAEVTQLLGPEVALVDVLLPALAEIGTAWEEGRASVAAEHFASGMIRAWLVSLLESATKSDPRIVALVGAAPDDQHEIPPLALTMLLRRRGWHVVFLGTGMPFDDLSDAIVRKRPQLVCLSASVAGSVSGLVDVLLQVRCLPEAGSVILTYGGLPFKTDHQLRDPLEGIATYLGDDLRGAAELASGLLEQRASTLAAASLD